MVKFATVLHKSFINLFLKQIYGGITFQHNKLKRQNIIA